MGILSVVGKGGITGEVVNSITMHPVMKRILTERKGDE
jgi:hypothetical protein